MKNVWQYRGQNHRDEAIQPDFLEAVGGSPLVARLLLNRGITTPKTAKAFLDLENYQPSSGYDLPDMELGVRRIVQALDNEENILIFGDFDVDGITGTSVLYETLKRLKAKVSYYIPDRATEGHGLNVAALCRLVSTRQLKLVISTDTGITNYNEVSLLKGLKVDTIITDHHDLPENLPPSVANINPKLLPDQSHPLALLAGVGVAFKLCELLLEVRGYPPEQAEALLDLVAVGTIADLVPLIRENRYLAYRGIQVLNKHQRLGINQIIEQAVGKTDNIPKPEIIVSSETVGFMIGPRLNALGRLDKAGDAVELLTTQDAERARVIASHLEYLNRRRQELCEKTFLEAEKHMAYSGGLEGKKAIILGSPDWNPGIIGIVASRLIEKYHVPVFLMVIDESKEEARGSARSIPGFHVNEALTSLAHYFTHFGGHSGAAGFALKLDKLDAFKRDMFALAERKITEEQMLPLIEVDEKLEWSQLNPHLVEMISSLAPFGKDNPSPLFSIENVNLAAQKLLGAEGKHLKLILQEKDPQKPVEALIWNVLNKGIGNQGKLDPTLKYHLVVSPELNTFNNTTKIQLIVQDIQPAGTSRVQETSLQNSHKLAPSIPSEPSDSKEFTNNDTPDITHQRVINWIDHRSRESIESFVGQLMLPLQDGRKILLFHEGRKPQIPFLQEEIIAQRQTISPSEDLILWDIPADLEIFQRLIDVAQPKVIHLIGGKYQTVPVFPQVRDYLKIIYQTLIKQMAQGPSSSSFLQIQFEELASQLACTQSVIYQGLILLVKVGLVQIEEIIQTEELGTKASSAKPSSALLSLPPSQAQTNPLGDPAFEKSLEWVTMHQALNEMGKFRSWVIKSPIEKIKSLVMTESHPLDPVLPHSF